MNSLKYKIIIIFITFLSNLAYCQSNYDELINYLKENNDSFQSVICYGSTSIIKAEYYLVNDYGYVIVYFKQNDYDVTGSAYVYCNISQNRWNNFTNGGYTSWGQSYHNYLKKSICNPQMNSNPNKAYRSSSLPDLRILDRTLSSLQRKYDNSPNRNSYRNYNPAPAVEIFGKENLNYKFGLGISYGTNAYGLNLNLRISKKLTVENIYSKFISQKTESYNSELFNKQFGITSMLNYNTSINSDKLFFVSGMGLVILRV